MAISRSGTAAIAGIALLAGCGGASRSAPVGVGSLPADSVAQLEAIYQARIEAGRARFTEADVHFMTRMIGHHTQALEMAALADDRTDDGQIRTLAARIHASQVAEIATMQSWLRERGQPVVDPASDHARHGPMPGMISAEQMRTLVQARGGAFDRLFLRLMIHHHQGAVTMVHDLFATDGAGQDEEVFKFASDAQVDQRTEIQRMQRMLEARGG